MISDELIAKAAFEVDQAILASLPDPSECHHVFSEKFERKMKRLIRKAEHYTVYKILQRAACILIALILFASMFLALNPDARAAITEWIEEKFGEFYHYFFTSTNEELERNTYAMGWVPEGYKAKDYYESGNTTTTMYINDAGQMLRFDCVHGSETTSIYTGVGNYKRNFISTERIKAEVLVSDNPLYSNVITWTSEDGNIRFTITGFLGEADLLKIAENVVAEKINKNN